jgi:hypothetical protein
MSSGGDPVMSDIATAEMKSELEFARMRRDRQRERQREKGDLSTVAIDLRRISHQCKQKTNLKRVCLMSDLNM